MLMEWHKSTPSRLERGLTEKVRVRDILGLCDVYVADLGTRENVEVRLLPFRAGFPLGMPLTPFITFQFGKDARGKLTEPTVVFAESFAGAMYFERPTEVDLYREAFGKGARP
ncbi:Scr1 family TA system antitoxin-like transcriptional regulator [Nocardia inohanensis]|uniref:Scr1 family TA system antitoxin-like transcriptional regulator n=1 Tax=Nocardia inohanensis TaxID=209246 RepID=UPI000830F14B|nr:Scr1 family TA system antitoxin-like transcriptional regulator [Nocardia inohanensis]